MVKAHWKTIQKVSNWHFKLMLRFSVPPVVAAQRNNYRNKLQPPVSKWLLTTLTSLWRKKDHFIYGRLLSLRWCILGILGDIMSFLPTPMRGNYAICVRIIFTICWRFRVALPNTWSLYFLVLGKVRNENAKWSFILCFSKVLRVEVN